MRPETGGLRRLVSRAARLPLRLVPKGIVVRVLSGELRGARWVVGKGTHGCWLGTYEALTREWMGRIAQPGHVCFDVGANVGFFTLLASRLVGPRGRVIAFEPLPANVETLRHHVEINDCQNVRIIEEAVADRTGVARFTVAASPEMGGLSEGGELEVRTLSLDEAIGSGVLPEPDLLKIDVEGAELRVLGGAHNLLSRKRPAIVLSAHGWQLFEASCELLRATGYGCRVVRDGTADGDYLVVALDEAKAG